MAETIKTLLKTYIENKLNMRMEKPDTNAISIETYEKCLTMLENYVCETPEQINALFNAYDNLYKNANTLNNEYDSYRSRGYYFDDGKFHEVDAERTPEIGSPYRTSYIESSIYYDLTNYMLSLMYSYGIQVEFDENACLPPYERTFANSITKCIRLRYTKPLPFKI